MSSDFFVDAKLSLLIQGKQAGSQLNLRNRMFKIMNFNALQCEWSA